LIAAGAVALLLLESLAVAAAQPKGRLRITVLDVGQGDSIVVDFPDGRGMLIDGGGVVGSPVDPGLRVVSPVLRARRRNVLSLAVLTHPHPDHVIGLASTVPQVSVGELWDTGQGEREGAGPTYAGLLSGVRGRGIPVRRPSDLCGKVFPFGEVRMRVLGPCPDIVPGRGGNDNSFVLHLRLGARSALLVGDAEREQESDLLRLEPALLRADLLKVGHHGSKTSTSTAFLDAVAPHDAIITSGVRNRYGHPAPETLEVLRQRGVRVSRSDRHGAVRWETDGESVWVTTVVGRSPEGP
jgi:competence protein ComEC